MLMLSRVSLDCPADGDRQASDQCSGGGGVSTLEEVVGCIGVELLVLHGVGPTAVRVLEEELGRHGRSRRSQ